MIELARLVAEGALRGNDDQRALALRLLGIGLYLDGRVDGAERAFVELIKLRPRMTLDATATRPEVVGFFKEVKRRHGPRKRLAFAFLPPLGQFQNDDTPLRGWLIGGLEVATLGTAITTALVLSNWRAPDQTCRGQQDPKPCTDLRLVNQISVAAFAATWAAGVIDALVNHSSGESTDVAATRGPRLVILPNGAALHTTF